MKRKIGHQKSHYSRRASRSKTRRSQLQAQIWREPHSYQPSAFAASGFLEHQDDRTGRCQTGDYCAPRRGASGGILFERSGLHLAALPVNCRRSTTAVRAASGTAGKMNSSEAEPRHAAPPARAACEGRLWPQQVDQTGVKACRRRAVVARAETAAEEPSAVASQRLPGSPSGSLAHSEQGCAFVELCMSEHVRSGRGGRAGGRRADTTGVGAGA